MKAIIIILALFSFGQLYSQDAKEFIRKGNKEYNKKKFNEAEINYRKSLELENKSHKAVFNLGDALYKQEQYDKASQEFSSIANGKHDEQTISKAYHNLGNSLLKSQKYEECIDAYKKSLKLNPKDVDTKYNLEYAKMMLQKQQQQQNQQNKNQQNQDKQQQQQQQQQNQNNDNKDKKQQQQQNQEQKISPKDAERMLQALNQEEKKLQDKRKKKAVGVKGKVEKEW
ncbi:MAG: tetratricopeptide repeat protein [bacterium]